MDAREVAYGASGAHNLDALGRIESSVFLDFSAYTGAHYPRIFHLLGDFLDAQTRNVCGRVIVSGNGCCQLLTLLQLLCPSGTC